MEVTNYSIHQGSTGALDATQLRRGGLLGLEPGFSRRSSLRNREDLAIYSQPMVVAVSDMMDVLDIILNAPHE